jgi:hypothetical protein
MEDGDAEMKVDQQADGYDGAVDDGAVDSLMEPVTKFVVEDSMLARKLG